MSRPGQTEEEGAFSEEIANEQDVESTEEGSVEENDDESPAVRPDGKPFTAADLRRIQDTLKKARKEARAAKAATVTADEAKTSADAAAEAALAAEAKYKPVVVRQAARAAFSEAGLVLPRGRADAAMARALKLIDVSELDINEDGDVEGLDDQIEDIKAEFPELFAATRRPGRVDAAGRDGSNRRPKTSNELLAAQLLG